MANFTSTADNATAISPAYLNGELTISSSTTAGFTTVEDITGITTVYILDDENTSDYVAKTGTVSGTVGSQVFTYDVANASAATHASDETIWVNASLVISDNPTEIVVENTSTTTQIDTYTPTTTGATILAYNATDGIVERTAGTVTTIAGLVSSTDPFSDGSLLDKYQLDSVLTSTTGGTALTVNGTTAYVSGVWDNALSLNGSSYAEVTRASIKTIVMRFKRTIANGTEGYLFDARYGSGDGFLYQAVNGSLSFSNGTLKVDAVGKATGVFVPVQDTWYQIEFTINAVGTAIRFGASNIGATYNTCAIDQIELYSRVLTSGESTFLLNQIETIYQAPITATSIPTTKAFFNSHVNYRLASESTGARCIAQDETLTLTSSTTLGFVATSTKSGMLYDGDSVHIDGTTNVACVTIVEVDLGGGTYEYTGIYQSSIGSPAISAKVLDRSVALTMQRTYNVGNNNFDATMAIPLNVDGRALKLVVDVPKSGSVVEIDSSIINLNKAG